MHHAGAGDGLEDGLDSLPPPEANHGRSHSPGIQSHGRNEEQMAGYAVQLAQDNPHVLRSLRYFKTHQLFHGGAINQFIVEIGEVIHAVEQGNYLMVLLTLAQLLRTTVQVADVGLHIRDLLPINPQHHAEHPVGRRVLRTHVEQHLHRFAAGSHLS